MRQISKFLRTAASQSLIWLDRLLAVDVLLFAAALLIKLHYFNELLSVKYMDMTNTMRTIELGAALLLGFWTLLLPTRGRLMALIVLNFAVSFLLFADVVYYRYFQDLITVPVLLQAGQVESLGGSISTLIYMPDFLLFLDFVILIPFAIYLLWKGRKDLRVAKEARRPAPIWRTMAIRVVLGAVVLAIGSQLYFPNVNAAKESSKSLFAGNWWNLSIYNAIGGLGFHSYDISRYAKLNWFKSETVSAQEQSETQQWLQQRGLERKELEKDPTFGAYKGKNVLMVQVEALQDFMFDTSIGGKEITPNLNQLVKESAYYNNFYHQTSNGRTSDADFAANCSMQPIMNGSVFIQYSSNTFDCMPNILKDHNYSASVFHAYQGGFWNRNTMYKSMNYDMFYNIKHFVSDESVGWSVGDKSFFRQSIDVLADQKKPFYGFLITLTSHHPYSMPASEKKLDVGELTDTILGNYLQSVHYVDAAVGELVDRLKEEDLWDDTILILYGDHDNSIKDWELYAKLFNKPLTEFEQKRFNKQVPLLVHLPDGAYAGEYSLAGGQTDLAPTILHLLGISTADYYMVGKPLVLDKPLEDHVVVQRYGSWSNESVYYIPAGNNTGTCYSLETGQPVDGAMCAAGTEKAHEELLASDNTVIHNLIKRFRKNGSLEVKG